MSDPAAYWVVTQSCTAAVQCLEASALVHDVDLGFAKALRILTLRSTRRLPCCLGGRVSLRVGGLVAKAIYRSSLSRSSHCVDTGRGKSQLICG
jgi:hypothetical protein